MQNMDWTGLDWTGLDRKIGIDSFKLFSYDIFAFIRLYPVPPLKDAGRL